MEYGASLLLFVGVAFLVAGSVKGVIGMGLPTVSVGVLSIVVAPAQAAALAIAPALITNIWQSLAGPNLKALLRRLWTFLGTVCIGIWFGAGLLTGDTSGRAAIALGICLMLYALLGLSSVHFRVPPRAEPWLSPVIGAITGVVTGATGIFVIPAVPYLHSLDMERDHLLQALGISFVVSSTALGIVLARHGILQATVAGVSLAAVAPALLGMVLGQLIRGRIKAATFRLCFFLGMLALGAHLALRALI